MPVAVIAACYCSLQKLGSPVAAQRHALGRWHTLQCAVEPLGTVMAPRLTLTVLGTGAGATAVYSGEPSSAFVLSVNGTPVLLADVGLGTVQQCVRLVGSLPACVYVSHNHTDHAGELPVLLAVEAARAATKHVYAHPDVARRLQQHRLHELHSTGAATAL